MSANEQNEPKIEYMIWDVAELISVCTAAELQNFDTIVERIIRKREAQGKPLNTGFLVVDINEPYAQEVADLIKKRKEGQ